uniref:Predicted o-methyltransferase n=1 Tax=uncultured Chloroflexi bacterium HF0500_03M05 TaxID=710737 RepID=E0XY62_9CHLR|nr:predicted o-methyltransferase [uncultured Chloroflexi bacterium HF0500_03M05]
MESEVKRVLHRLEEEDVEDRKMDDRPREERMFTLHSDSAQLLHIMIQTAGCKRLVEIGVAFGYSTIWLAHAAQLTGGRLTSLEVNPKTLEFGKQNVAEAGLSDMVDFIEGDALETLHDIQGPLDFVMMDCWEEIYIPCLEIIVPLLRPGGLLVTDNVTPGESGTDPFIKVLREHPLMETVSVPIGRDIEISVKSLTVMG